MHQFVQWLFMSIRWLLVAVLPLLCPIVGLRLKPEITPKWHVDLAQKTKCGGIIHDQGMSCLVLEGGRTFDMGLPAVEFVCLDIATGREAASYKIPDDDMHDRLVCGTSNVIYHRLLMREIYLYDWHRKADTTLHLKETDGLLISESIVSQNNCAVRILGVDGNTINCWRKSDPEPVFIVKLNDGNNRMLFNEMEFSSNDKWMMLSHTVLMAPTVQNIVRIFDIETGKVVKTLPGITRSIYWHPQDSSFLALQENTLGQACYWQRYVFEHDKFIAVGARLAAPIGKVLRQGPGVFIVMHSTTGDSNLRERR